MDSVGLAVVVLSCVLLICIGALATFFVRHKSPRARSEMAGSVSAGSSSRSRMASRWAHMEQASLGSKRGQYRDGEEVIAITEDQSDDFGVRGGMSTPRARSQPSQNSLSGTGPNGTRTFLKGWFGLDEPSFSGIKIGADEKEKLAGDILVMSPPSGAAPDDLMAAQHHRIPANEEEAWEAHSERGFRD